MSLLRLRGRYLKVIFILFFILTINSLYATTDSLIQKELAQKALEAESAVEVKKLVDQFYSK